MQSNILHNLAVPISAGVIVDKLILAKRDAWALSVRLSSGLDSPLLAAFLWSVPQLGCSQLMAGNFPLGEPLSYGVIIGDGQRVSSINPLLTEWLFCRKVLPSGSCAFVTLGNGQTAPKWRANLRSNSSAADILAVMGLPALLFATAFLTAVTSVSYYSALFIGCLYLSTLLSNLYLAGQSCNTWAGYTSDTQETRMLVVAPSDRWAVLHGPRNLIKMATTGSHTDQSPSILRGMGQYMLIFVVLSAALLSGASFLDGLYISCVVILMQVLTSIRANLIVRSLVIRGAAIKETGIKVYRRRADLIGELSEAVTSDAWAYESGLLSRRYVPESHKLISSD